MNELAADISLDLHLGNLLLQPPTGIDSLTDQQLYDQYDIPEAEPVVREDEQPLSPGVPSHVYTPIWMGKQSNEISLSESRLLLADWGTAFRPDEQSRFASYTPLEIRPPKARFEPAKPLTFASDVWSLGCMIWAILGVKPFLGSWLFGPEHVTAAQMDGLGPMPNEWWGKWKAKAKTGSFSANGIPTPGRVVWTFEKRFEDCIQQPRRENGMETIAEDERGAMFAMIKGMLKSDPCDRLSAQQVLETEWMRRWAIPRAEKAWNCEALSSEKR